jgi:hypothetical protein
VMKHDEVTKSCSITWFILTWLCSEIQLKVTPLSLHTFRL